MATMDFQIRKTLKLMALYDTVDRGELSLKSVGDKTISTLLENGWATLSHSTSGIARYSITDSGRKKAAEPSPPNAQNNRTSNQAHPAKDPGR